MRKSIRISVWVMIFLFLLPCGLLFAAEPGGEEKNEKTGYRAVIQDEAMLFTKREIGKLIEEMRPITAYGNVLLYTSLSDTAVSASAYAEAVYLKEFGDTKGVVFLIDLAKRNLFIMANGSAYDVITRRVALMITDNVYSLASSYQYYECASKAFSQILVSFEGGRIFSPMKLIGSALFSLMTALFICYFLILLLHKEKKLENCQIFGALRSRFSVSDEEKDFLSARSYIGSSGGSGYRGGRGGGRSFGGGGRSGGGGGRRGGGGHRF